MSTNLLIGKGYSIALKSGAPKCLGNTSTLFAAWIDYNQDGKFSEDERLGNTFAAEPDKVVQLQFNVSKKALLGPTRLRIRYTNSFPGSNTILDPCKETDFGETEDYTVNIVTLNLSTIKPGTLQGPIRPIKPQKLKLKDRRGN